MSHYKSNPTLRDIAYKIAEEQFIDEMVDELKKLIKYPLTESHTVQFKISKSYDPITINYKGTFHAFSKKIMMMKSYILNKIYIELSKHINNGWFTISENDMRSDETTRYDCKIVLKQRNQSNQRLYSPPSNIVSYSPSLLSPVNTINIIEAPIINGEDIIKMLRLVPDLSKLKMCFGTISDLTTIMYYLANNFLKTCEIDKELFSRFELPNYQYAKSLDATLTYNHYKIIHDKILTFGELDDTLNQQQILEITKMISEFSETSRYYCNQYLIMYHYFDSFSKQTSTRTIVEWYDFWKENNRDELSKHLNCAPFYENKFALAVFKLFRIGMKSFEFSDDDYYEKLHNVTKQIETIYKKIILKQFNGMELQNTIYENEEYTFLIKIINYPIFYKLFYILNICLNTTKENNEHFIEMFKVDYIINEAKIVSIQ